MDKLRRSQRLTEKQNVRSATSVIELYNSPNILTENFSERFPPNQQSFAINSSDNNKDSEAQCKTDTFNEYLMQPNAIENDSSTVINLCVRSKAISGAVRSQLAEQTTIDLCTPVVKDKKTIVKSNADENLNRNVPKKMKMETKIIKAAAANSRRYPQRNTATTKRSRLTLQPASDTNKKFRSSKSNRSSTKQRKSCNNTQSQQTYLFPPKPFRYYDNTNIDKEYSVGTMNLGVLPAVYPPHFVHQHCISEFISPRAEHFNTVYRDGPSLPRCMDMQENIYHTPDFLQCYNFETQSTSTPSLPDSMRGVFDSDDIREILRIEKEKVAYHLMEHHVRALAFVLGLSEEYFRYVVDNILKLSPTVVEKIVIGLEAASTANTVSPNAEEETSIISSSPNANPSRYFPSQRRTQ